MKRLLLLAVLAAACDDEISISTVAPVAVLSPAPGTPLSFEEVVLGKTKPAPLIVTTENEGESELVVSARLESTGPIRVSSFNARVQPGDYGEVFVRFEPTAHGDSETVLIVETNDPELPEARYPITGRARERCALYAWPPFQEFRLHDVREVTIYNESLSPCELTRIFMEGEDLFRVLDAPVLPHVIPPLGELVLHAEHIQRTEVAGAPVRQLHIKERDGIELLIGFQGALPVWSCLGVFPDVLHFPDTDLGVRGRARAVVYSFCDEPAEVRSAHVGIGYYYFDVDQQQFPIVVPPLGQAEVEIGYNPLSEFGDTGRLTINTNDASNRQLRIGLEGKAVIPELLTLPEIDFGAAVPSCSERLERVPLLAMGEARTIVTSLRIAGDPGFSIEGVFVEGVLLPDPTPPFTIPSGSSGQVVVRFAPSREDPAEHRAELIVEHNGLDTPRSIALIGRAVPAGGKTESFTAPAAATVDLLMVIDDSRSMIEEQERLRATMPGFLTQLDSMTADYQIAVLAGEEESRSPGWPHSCPPHPYVIDEAYGDAATALSCAMINGYSSGRRAAFGSAIRGLHRAVDPSSNPNPLPSFLREDADLAVLIVSDEEDQSKAGDAAFRDFVHSVKGSYRPDRVRVHAIARDPTTTCASDPWALPGERYVRITRETGGTFQDVCTSDFSPLLSNLAGTIFAPTHRFDLSQPADPSTLTVQIDGAPISESATDGYVFDPAMNAVHLRGASQPAPGSVVTIGYGDACR